MPVVYIHAPPRAGMAPLRVGRNGRPVDAMRLRQAARYVNGLSATRLKVIGRIHVPVAAALNTTTDTVAWRWMGHTSVNASSVRYEMVVAPCSSSDSAITPKAYWVVKALDTSTNPATVSTTTTCADIVVTARDTGTVVLDDLVRVSGSIPVSGSTTYAWELHVVDRCRPVSCALFEETHEGKYLSTSSYTLASPHGFNVGAGIYTRDVGGLLTAWDSVWDHGGSQHFAWTVHNGTAKTRTSTSSVNVLDGATTAYAANAPGFWCQSLNRSSLTGTKTSTRFYVYAAMSAGTTGEVKFVDSGTTVATISSIGAAGYYTVADGMGVDADRKLDVLHKSGHASNSISTYAAGAFELVA